MSDLNAVEFPRGIDDPHIVLLWTIDEMVILMIFFLVGFILDHAVIGGIAGFIAMRQFMKFNAGKQDGILIHDTYWAGLLPTKKNSHFKNPFIRKWFP